MTTLVYRMNQYMQHSNYCSLFVTYISPDFRFDEYHEASRPHMRAAYFAYLQNTPGSRKAIYDCMKETSRPKEKEEPTAQAVA